MLRADSMSFLREVMGQFNNHLVFMNTGHMPTNSYEMAKYW